MSQVEDQIIEQMVVDKGLTAPRVTKDIVDELMARVVYHTELRPMGSTSTIVHAFLDGKFLLASGSSGCVDPANFDADIGYRIAASKAIDAARERLWEHMGFQLYMQQCRQKEPDHGHHTSKD